MSCEVGVAGGVVRETTKKEMPPAFVEQVINFRQAPLPFPPYCYFMGFDKNDN